LPVLSFSRRGTTETKGAAWSLTLVVVGPVTSTQELFPARRAGTVAEISVSLRTLNLALTGLTSEKASSVCVGHVPKATVVAAVKPDPVRTIGSPGLPLCSAKSL
jgi:hypothetical protein